MIRCGLDSDRNIPWAKKELPDSQLKELTRGKDGINRDTLHKFIDGLAIPEAEKSRLREMTPQSYIGNAAILARRIGN